WGVPGHAVQFSGHIIKLAKDFIQQGHQLEKSFQKQTKNLRTDISDPAWGGPGHAVRFSGHITKQANDFIQQGHQLEKGFQKQTKNLRTDISDPAVFATLEFYRHDL
ncbi:hypothetical protein, partial, partial [Absidia glauca]